MIKLRTGSFGMNTFKTTSVQKTKTETQETSINVDELCNQFEQGQLTTDEFREKLTQLGATRISIIVQGCNGIPESVNVSFELNGKNYSVRSNKVPGITRRFDGNGFHVGNDSGTNLFDVLSSDFDIEDFYRRRKEYNQERERKAATGEQRSITEFQYKPTGNANLNQIVKGHCGPDGMHVDEIRTYNSETGEWEISNPKTEFENWLQEYEKINKKVTSNAV